MMKRWLCRLTPIAWLIALAVLALLSWQAVANEQGGQYERFGNWEVHYIAFPSTMLTPEIANAYNVRRSGSRGVVNISVLDAEQEGKPGQRVSISGYALNNLGQRQNLSFRRFIEEPAIYYIAEVSHVNEDRLRFFITINHGDRSEELRFVHTFYRD